MAQRRYQLLFISLAVFEIYIPTLLAGLCYVDDVQMCAGLFTIHDWSLKNLFIPTGTYYRPLLSLTFFLDKELWLMNEHIMHAENVLLHLCNTALVYHITKLLLPGRERKKSLIPAIAALCFALHPINSEPVNWISGRTDLLAGTFVLLSTLYLVKFRLTSRNLFLALATASLLLGVLSKEVALGFVPAIFLILIAKVSYSNEADRKQTARHNNFVVICCLFMTVIIVLTGLYFVARSSTIGLGATAIHITIRDVFAEPVKALLVSLRALGFYVKKVYLPLPLNFTIREVDPLYWLLAIPYLLVCLLTLLNRTLVSALFIAGGLMIFPALAIAFGHIAWMPYAERYLYIPSAFFIIPTVMYLNSLLAPLRYKTAISLCCISIVLTLSLLTLQRNIYWMKTSAPYQQVKGLAIIKGSETTR